MLAPPNATVWEEVQPERSVFARAATERERIVRRELVDGILNVERIFGCRSVLECNSISFVNECKLKMSVECF